MELDRFRSSLYFFPIVLPKSEEWKKLYNNIAKHSNRPFNIKNWLKLDVLSLLKPITCRLRIAESEALL